MCGACAQPCWRDLALISIIIRTKDARALTDRRPPSAAAWAFVLVATQAAFRLLSTSVQLHVRLGTQLTRLCVSGSSPSEAYYQNVTEDGRQQPRRLKPGPWLIGHTMAWGNQRGSYQPGGRKGGCSTSFPHPTEFGLLCSFVEHAGKNTYWSHTRTVQTQTPSRW